MAAGQGFKTFATGEVLTAGDVNGYLMQGVLVFASAAARDAAITSPQEGQFAYLKDTNVTTYYTGSAWTNLDTTGMVNPMTTTGDTIYSSSGSTPARLGIGTTGQVLSVSGGVPAWATVSSGGMTLISTINASAATSVSFTSIPTTYKHLMLVWKKCQSDGVGRWGVRLNSDTDSDYTFRGVNYNGTSLSVVGVTAALIGNNNTNSPILETAYSSSLWDYACNGYMWLYDYTATSNGVSYSYESMAMTEGSSDRYVKSMGTYNNSAAVTQIDFIRNTTQTITGQFLLYGVS